MSETEDSGQEEMYPNNNTPTGKKSISVEDQGFLLEKNISNHVLIT